MSLLLASSGDIASGVVEAEGVDFDGVNDYLSRSTDLVGNVDSKTFTFSCWVYMNNDDTYRVIYGGMNTGDSFYGFNAVVNNNESVRIYGGLGTSYTMDVTIPVGNLAVLTYTNILVSMDLTNVSNRHTYVNDRAVTATWTTYTNANIGFTTDKHSIAVGATDFSSLKLKGRLSNLFLDYTYSDLSIEANRRLFITADGKPADGWKALSPIIGMSMKDAATAHINDFGTGGNFTPNGTIATSERGANQDNCVASKFDGSADYLSKASLGLISTQTATFSFIVNAKDTTESDIFTSVNSSNSNVFIRTSLDRLQSDMKNSASSRPFEFSLSGFYNNVTYSVQIGIDTRDINKCKVYINGFDTSSSANIAIIVNSFMEFNNTINIGRELFGTTDYTYGSIGELYFDTKYIDLSTSNPFWDSVANKPIPVRKVIADTGVTPLIAMPLDASNAGKNYGTGGDFTANSAPYVGARGGSEFWARSAKFDGSASGLEKTSLGTLSQGTTVSFMFAHKNIETVPGNQPIFLFQQDTTNRFSVELQVSTTGATGCEIKVNNSLACSIPATTFTVNTWNIYLVCIDLTTPTNSKIYVNGIERTGTGLQSFTGILYLNLINDFNIGLETYNRNIKGDLSICYFTTDYIDFSQETERLKFVNAMGYPLDLGKQIEKGIIPNPLIYLPFDDPTNLGKNLGTGGTFSVVGSVLQGSDVNG